MRWPKSLLADAALALPGLALLLLLVIPWPERLLPDGVTPPGAAASTTADAAAPARGSVVAGAIEALFAAPAAGAGGTGAPAPPSPAPTVAPAEAPWLRYLGRSTGDDGTAVAYVKDSRTGRVILLARGEPRAGWTLVEEDALRIVARNADGLFAVAKR